MATDFSKLQFAGVYKSFYDFASRLYEIDNLLTGSGASPAAFKSLYPIHVFDVSKQSERLTEGVVDFTVRMEFSANVPANTQAYALVRTKPKDSFTLVVSDNSANIQTTFNPPLYLQANHSYELAMVNLEAYYSFANIRKVNNSFK